MPPHPRDEAGEPSQADDGLDEHVDEQEEESFPASDPHSDWSGPPTRQERRG
jgi:hypothetical protein